MRRVLALAALALMPAVAGCGSSGDPLLDFLFGPDLLSVPVFDDGAQKTIGLRNLANADAPVRLNWLPRGLGAGSTDVTVPARGELRLNVPFLEGWIVADTRDPITSLPIPTTGAVEAFLWAQRSGPDVEASHAATLHTSEHIIPIHPRTARVSLLNFDAAVQVYTVCVFGPAGGAPLSVVAYPVPANDSIALDDFGMLPEGVGQLSIIPPGTMPLFSVASQDDEDIVYEVNDQILLTSRLLDAGPSSLAGLGVDWGRDTQSGRTLDFDVLMVNGSDLPRSYTLYSIYDAFGSPVTQVPITVTLQARESRLYRTTLVDSIGIELGEPHPFAAFFGDVFAATNLTRYAFRMSLDEGLFATARVFDPFALDAAMRVRPSAPAHVQSAITTGLQTTASGGILNIVTLINPTSGPLPVDIRAFTPVKGTEYVLGRVTVPPNSMLDWSPDALGLREDVGDITNPPVRDLRLRFTSNIPFNVFARQEGRNASNLIVFVTPHIVRLED
jgi:hypothetical protein